MSYLTQNEIASNGAMIARVSQCAAEENIPDHDAWVIENRRDWAAAPGWDSAWESAWASHPPDPPDPENPPVEPYDPGQDEAVITDAMILSQVQSMAPTKGGNGNE